MHKGEPVPQPSPPTRPRLLDRGSWREVSRITDVLRIETVGGTLLVATAAVALLWANSPWAFAYFHLSAIRIGPAQLHLDLTLARWAADGLLAVFFFVAGLELKREFVAGDLRDPRRAALPIAAAMGGMVVPALFYIAINLAAEDGDLSGWAIPTATDIAFALAVLAVIGTHLPAALRTFLLTLAVVDDLVAITIIAVVYTQSLSLAPLALAVIPLALFGILVQRRVRSWWLLLPLAVTTWALVHESGVHATVAGVLLGFLVPVARRSHGPGPGLAEHFEHRWRPVSAGVAVPIFAFSLPGSPSAAPVASAPPCATASPSVSSSAWSPARSLASSARPTSCSASPEPSSPTAWVGGTSWASRCWQASDLPSPCSSENLPSALTAPATATSRSACCSVHYAQRCWPASCSASATPSTDASARQRNATPTPTAFPISTNTAVNDPGH